MTCIICSATSGTGHVFREMMFGTRDQFEYWECSACGCLQLVNTPEQLGNYYPDGYYSFEMDLKPIDQFLYRVYFKAPQLANLIRRVRRNVYFADQKFQAVVEAKLKPGARVLDVGCGAGQLVTILRGLGFDAHGIDAFAKVETPFIRRSTLESEPGGWDLIMFHHSLEHMSDNVGVLRDAQEKLNPAGTCLVRIPLAAWAWKRYGKNWVQLDAPRHVTIHTPGSFRLAAEKAGFQVSKVIFDSTVFQFFGSEMYEKDIPLSKKEPERLGWTKEQSRVFSAQAEELNRQQMGDQASFYLSAANRSS